LRYLSAPLSLLLCTARIHARQNRAIDSVQKAPAPPGIRECGVGWLAPAADEKLVDRDASCRRPDEFAHADAPPTPGAMCAEPDGDDHITATTMGREKIKRNAGSSIHIHGDANRFSRPDIAKADFVGCRRRGQPDDACEIGSSGSLASSDPAPGSDRARSLVMAVGRKPANARAGRRSKTQFARAGRGTDEATDRFANRENTRQKSHATPLPQLRAPGLIFIMSPVNARKREGYFSLVRWYYRIFDCEGFFCFPRPSDDLLDAIKQRTVGLDCHERTRAARKISKRRAARWPALDHSTRSRHKASTVSGSLRPLKKLRAACGRSASIPTG